MHLRHLKALGLGSTRIGGAAVERLRATLPDCEISHSEREPSEEKKSGCFIATAAFGSPEALEVQAFRDLRDQVLARHASGRFVVSLYGRISPPMARFVTRSPAVKSGVRRVLRLLLVLLERRA